MASAFLEKLLDGANVEWLPLGEIAELVRGNGLQKKDFTETGIPAIHYGQIYTYYGVSTEKTISYVSQATADKLKKVNYGDIIITNTSENIEDVCKALTYLGKKQAVTGGHATIVKPKAILNSKYFTYFTQTTFFYQAKIQYAHGTKVIDVSATDLAKVLIPMPCPDNPQKSLAIQTKIVDILDKFTEYKSELAARISQFEYYRNSLFDFKARNIEVMWKRLGEMANDFGRGKSRHRPRNDHRLYGGKIPFIQTGDIKNASHKISNYFQNYSEFGLSQSKLWPEGTLCITIAANIAETAILGFDACFPDSIIGFIPDPDKTTSDYVEYVLSNYRYAIQNKRTGSAQDNINISTFENLKFPFPNLAEQACIVSILDKFDELINSVKIGLPREIELRQKQYEYYRDLLFAFDRP